MAAFTLKVNGKPRTVDVAPDTPLLWVLRDTLELTGTKYGCGMSLCGACTVHLNGEPIRSCVTKVADAANGSITTIEGLSADRSHPIQKAWMAEEVPQCGYCQSGMIMSAAALLAKNANPQDNDIDAALGGHICRCGTYQRIRRAIHRAARAQAGGPFRDKSAAPGGTGKGPRPREAGPKAPGGQPPPPPPPKDDGGAR